MSVRSLVVWGLGLAALNLVAVAEWQDLRERRRALEMSREQESEKRAQRGSEARILARYQQLALDAASGMAAPRPFAATGIGTLRDALVAAQGSLPLNRLSLEFRPDDGAPEGMSGARISASLRGRYATLYQYLDRVESRRLALTPEQVMFRDDGSGSVLLTVSWTARWRASQAAAVPPELPVARLQGWLGRGRSPVPGRDPFQVRTAEPMAPDEASRSPSLPALSEVAVVPEPETQDDLPDLTGFVLARPEVERDPGRRVLAALRFEGEMHLVGEGDVLGTFRVARIAARESVTLLSEDGSQKILRLE